MIHTPMPETLIIRTAARQILSVTKTCPEARDALLYMMEDIEFFAGLYVPPKYERTSMSWYTEQFGDA